MSEVGHFWARQSTIKIKLYLMTELKIGKSFVWIFKENLYVAQIEAVLFRDSFSARTRAPFLLAFTWQLSYYSLRRVSLLFESFLP